MILWSSSINSYFTYLMEMLEDTSLIVDEYSSECKFMYQEIDEIIRKYQGGFNYA